MKGGKFSETQCTWPKICSANCCW